MGVGMFDVYSINTGIFVTLEIVPLDPFFVNSTD